MRQPHRDRGDARDLPPQVEDLETIRVHEASGFRPAGLGYLESQEGIF